ncbi:MAG: proline dehydrogenase family protein [Proteobacteria bacterium]|nr:proline dehydrogenase family protein [Pseudomonadota bacterium]
MEERITSIGEEIFALSRKGEGGIFDKNFWTGKMMDWSMKNPSFKVELFRFIDVLPSLKKSDQVAQHVKSYFLRPELELSPWIKTTLSVAAMGGVPSKIASASIKRNVLSMAETFICGRDADTAEASLKKLWVDGFAWTLDILGEVVVSESEADKHFEHYLNLIKELPAKAEAWPAQHVLDESALGPIPRVNVSVKCSSLFSHLDNLCFDHSVNGIKKRLRILMTEAKNRNVFLHLDMEQNDLRGIVMQVFEDLVQEEELLNYPHFGIVCQAYLKDALKDLERLKNLAIKRKAPITIRLVKGAYWEYEYVMASQRDWPIPVLVGKSATDSNYEACSRYLLDSYPHLLGAFASHNVRSLAHAFAYAESKGLPKSAYECQMLFGMATPYKKALKQMNMRVREYTPVGDLLPGMAYLVRRLLENTSNEGFLKSSFIDLADTKKLLSTPNPQEQNPFTKESKMFHNEAFLDFSKAEVRSQMNEALRARKSSFPIKVYPHVNGETLKDLPSLNVSNPANHKQNTSIVYMANNKVADMAIETSKTAMRTWARYTPEERIAIIRLAANLIRERRFELGAQLVLEVGKNFREADADVAEAIDFCNYYAHLYEKIEGPQKMGDALGEENKYFYRPRGLTLAISPWNFPLAILCGMTVSSLICGNPVIMKPSEESSAVGQMLYEILREAGVPKEALQFVPGKGEEVGAYLVEHSKTHIISFTGSRNVGLWIMETAAKVKEDQRHIKKVVAEMGGKNAMIIDDDADLDEAVVAALQSAFGFQGQKCSALSRIIIVESAYETFKARFIEALNSRTYGPAEDHSAQINPVISEESQKRLLKVINDNQDKIAYQLPLSEELQAQGHFVPVTVFECQDYKSDLGQKEFFGPLVTLFKAKNFEEACQRFNDVDYALTGGVYTRNPAHIEYARNILECGNLYINRGITGALVYRQPFGGYKLSGVGAKAGGPDYLLQFLEPVTVTENIMRRGFSPELT